MEEKKLKNYVKPEMTKYQAAAIVSGSDEDCSLYKKETDGNTYYH